MKLLLIMYRTIFFYFFIMISYRLMGKREVGQLGIIDLIVSILIAELVAISIEKNDESIFLTIVPIVLLVIIEILFAKISIKNRSIRNIISGKPSIIINNGKINYKEMSKQRYSLDDLLIHLRQQQIKNINDVEYAILETNGKLSVFKYNLLKIKGNYPIAVIIEGKLQINTLHDINKTESWLLKELHKMGLDINEVYYAFYKKYELFVITYSSLKY